MNILGPRLKKRAAELGMSDTDVAKAAGFSTRAYGHYSNGRSEPNFDGLLRICKALQTTPNDLLGVRAPPSPGAPEMDEARLSRAAHLVLKRVYSNEEPEVMQKIADGLIATYDRLKTFDEEVAAEVQQIMADAPTLTVARKQ